MRATAAGITPGSGAAGEPVSPAGTEHRALVLLDRRPVVELIERTLNHGLFVVRAATDLAGAEAILATWQPLLAVVDLDNDDSTALLHELGLPNPMSASAIPVLGLTRWSDLETRLNAFDLGVDDILTMPFSPAELLARSIVIARRVAGVDRPFVPPIRIDDLEIDVVLRRVRSRDSVRHLSEIEQKLLSLLAGHPGRVFTRDEILDAVWGPEFVEKSNIVDRHVRSLRVKLRDDCRHPRIIATVQGQGYRFVATLSDTRTESGQGAAGRPAH